MTVKKFSIGSGDSLRLGGTVLAVQDPTLKGFPTVLHNTLRGAILAVPTGVFNRQIRATIVDTNARLCGEDRLQIRKRKY